MPPGSLRFPGDDEDDECAGFSEVHQTYRGRRARILELLGRDPEVNGFDGLFFTALDPVVIRVLAEQAPPLRVAAGICAQSWRMTERFNSRAAVDTRRPLVESATPR